MNAVTHGLRAKTIILPNESREDFDQIHDSLQQQYDPQNPAEQSLVDAAVIAQWKMVRAEVYETAAYDERESHIHRAEFFRGMIRAQNSLARLYSKAYNELERIKTARRKSAESIRPANVAPANSPMEGRQSCHWERPNRSQGSISRGRRSEGRRGNARGHLNPEVIAVPAPATDPRFPPATTLNCIRLILLRLLC